MPSKSIENAIENHGPCNPGGLENYFDEVNAALQNGTFNAEVHTQYQKSTGWSGWNKFYCSNGFSR